MTNQMEVETETSTKAPPIIELVSAQCPHCKHWVDIDKSERQERYVLKAEGRYETAGPKLVVACPRCTAEVVIPPGPPE